MDIQRLVLGIGLAVTTYMLILAWNEDYGDPLNAAAPVEVEQVYQQAPAADDLEVPQAQSTDTEAASEAGLPQALQTSGTEGLIRVSTDLLELSIDPLGGDIVHAALREYPVALDRPEEPFVLLRKDAVGTYVIQSGLSGPDGIDMDSSGRPRYQSAFDHWEMEDGNSTLTVELVYRNANQEIHKRFRFDRGDYRFRVSHEIRNLGEQPIKLSQFAQIKRDGSPDPSMSNSGMGMGMATYLGAATYTPDKPYSKLSFDDIEEDSYKQQVDGGWIGMLQHYFVSAVVPDSEQKNLYYTRYTRNGHYIAGTTGPQFEIKPDAALQRETEVYLGPKIQQRLEEISKGLELTVDYGWLWFIAQPIFKLLDWIHGYVGNWGWAIILVTVVIKALFYRLSAASYRSMANMRRIQPELVRMKELHGDDRQRMSQEMMALYKREKINPLGGCLPILVQIPVFIALYWVLLESVELRHAPFILWIEDLSVKDPLFVLPLLMGATMFLQQRLNPAPPDPVQARVLKMLPIIFTVFFLWFPAGLVLYWLINNVLSIAQQWWITRSIEMQASPAKS